MGNGIEKINPGHLQQIWLGIVRESFPGSAPCTLKASLTFRLDRKQFKVFMKRILKDAPKQESIFQDSSGAGFELSKTALGAGFTERLYNEVFRAQPVSWQHFIEVWTKRFYSRFQNG